MATMQKIISNLWFDRNAEEAVNFYTTVFKNSKIGRVSHYGKEGFEIHGMPDGTVLTIEFWLNDQEFLALNGGPVFKFNEAVSFIISCDSQEEIDYYWERLGEGGDEKAQQCGWLKDKYGLSWQIVPKILNDMLSDPDKSKTERVMKVLFPMKRLEINTFMQAFAQE